MLNFIYFLSLIVTILILWFKTNVFVEYCTLFNVKIPKNVTDLSYPQFLYITFKNKTTLLSFFIKLITCVMCLSFWLSVIGGCLLGNVFYVPVFYITTLFLYFTLVRLIG
jgi:hypothetical protein